LFFIEASASLTENQLSCVQHIYIDQPWRIDVIEQKMNLVALLVVLTAAPLQVHAGDGFFVGGSIGSANLDDDFDGLKVDDDTTSFRIVGGWQVNRYFALEAGYHDFGDFEQNFTVNGTQGKAKLSADGFTLGAIGSYPVADRIDIFGRAGMFFWDGDAEINNVSQATPEDTNPFFGAGLNYAISSQFLVSADWTRYELESANSDVYSIGFQFRFGQ
jgi:OOP family OmpA-OmpF porin